MYEVPEDLSAQVRLSPHRKMCGKAPQRVECTICQRNFADGRGLSQHQKTVHKSDVYCIECRIPLKDMTAYENHRRNAHGLEPGPSTRNNNQEEVENLNRGPSRKVIITGVEVPAPHKVPEEEEVEEEEDFDSPESVCDIDVGEEETVSEKGQAEEQKVGEEATLPQDLGSKEEAAALMLKNHFQTEASVVLNLSMGSWCTSYGGGVKPRRRR